jgi:SAM-dependent methyltransferase
VSTLKGSNVKPTDEAEDGYLLQRSLAEYERLVRQAKVWEPATRRALDQAALRPGQSAFDAGCGAGEVMRLMAERVGEQGRVTGIDLDDRIGAQALAALRRRGPDIYRFVHGDLMQCTALGDTGFDLVFTRLLLIYMDRPLEVLRRLWRCVRPGGVLLVMDYDFTSMRSLTSQPACDQALQLIDSGHRAAGRDVEIGTRMPSMFLEAGIGEADGCEVSGLVWPAASSTAMLRNVLLGMRKSLTACGLSSDFALHRLDGDLAAAAELPIYLRWPDMVATWRRKPD